MVTLTKVTKNNMVYNVISLGDDTILVVVENNDKPTVKKTRNVLQYCCISLEMHINILNKQKDNKLSLVFKDLEIKEICDQVAPVGCEKDEFIFTSHTDLKSKFQKYDKDNVTSWKTKQFSNFIRDQYTQTYSSQSFEFGNGKDNSPLGRILNKVKTNMLNVFSDMNMCNSDLKNYIEWAYQTKSKEINFPITLNFLMSKSLMSEWLVRKRGALKKDFQSRYSAK